MSKFIDIDRIIKTKTVKMTKNNFWLLYLIYGDCACDETAVFQVPLNIRLGCLKKSAFI